MSAPYLTKGCTLRSTAVAQEPLKDWSLILTIFGSEFFHGAWDMVNAGHSSLPLPCGALSSFYLPLSPTPCLPPHLHCSLFTYSVNTPLCQEPSQCLLHSRNYSRFQAFVVQISGWSFVVTHLLCDTVKATYSNEFPPAHLPNACSNCIRLSSTKKTKPVGNR